MNNELFIESKMKTIYYIFLFVVCYGNAQNSLEQLLKQHNKEEIPYITVEKLKTLQYKAVILDAREKEEYQVSHLKNASYVGYNNFKIKTFAKRGIPKDSCIVVYCSLGIRSEDISEKLKKAGYTNVHNLYGGIFEWKNKEYPVIDTTGKVTSKVHVFSKDWGKWLLKGEKIY